MKKTFKKIISSLKANKDFLYFSIISIVGISFTAFSPLIVAKILNPNGFGSYSLSMAIVFLFFALSMSSSQAPCIILANREIKRTGKANHTFTILFFITAVVITLSSILSFLFRNQIKDFAHTTSPFLFLAILLAFIGYGIKSLAQTLLLGLNKKKSSAVLDAVFGLSSFIILIFFYILKITSLPLIISIYFPGGFITLFITLFIIKKDLFLPIQFNGDAFKEIIYFTRWQIIGLTAVYFVNWGDNFVLGIYVNIDKIGIYNLAYKLFGGMMTIIYFVNTYFLPLLSNKIDNKNTIKEYLSIKRPKIFSIILIGILAGVFIVPVLINFMYGKTYNETTPIFIILSIGLISFAYSVFYIPLLNSLGKYKVIQIVAVAQIIINISFDLLLIPLMGIYGAAIATTIGYFSILLIYQLYYKKVLEPYIDKLP